MEFDTEILKEIIHEERSTIISNIKFENITYFVKAWEREDRYMLVQYSSNDINIYGKCSELITIKEDEYKLRVKQKERSNKISIIIKHEN